MACSIPWPRFDEAGTRERLCTVHCVHVKEFRMVKISTEFSATAYLTTRSWFLANKNLAPQLKNNWHQALIEVQRILGTPVKFAEIETFWHSSFIQRRNTFYVVNAPYLVDVNYGIRLAKPGCSINWSNAALLLFIRQSPRLSSHVFLPNEITSQSAKWTLFFEQTSEPPSYFYAEQLLQKREEFQARNYVGRLL